MNHVTPKDAACRIIAFVVVAASLLTVGAVCLAAALKMIEANHSDQALVLTISFVVLTIGTGESAKQVNRFLSAVLPGRGNRNEP